MGAPKPIKIISYIIGLVAVLLLLAVILIPLVVNPDDYRGTIEQLVLEKTGRRLTIEGHMELSLFPWLGVKMGRVALADNPAFGPDPFVRFDSAGIRVKLLPLLSKSLEVDRVTLHGLHLKLRIDKHGAHNWDDLGKQGKAPATAGPPEKPAGPPLAALAIGGIDLQNAQLSWDDQQHQQHYEVEGLNLNSGPVTLGQAFDIDTRFRFTSKQPEIHGDVTLASKLSIDLKKQRYQARKLQLQLSLTGAAVPNGSLATQLNSDISTDLSQQTLTVEKLQLSSSGLNISGQLQGKNIIDQPQLQGTLHTNDFSPRKLMTALALPVPQTADPKVLDQARLQLQFAASTDSLSIRRLTGKLDDTGIEASGGIKHFGQPVITLNARLDTIDLDRYLSPAAKDAPPETPASAAAAGGLQLPMKTLRRLNLDGQFKIGALKVSGMHLRDCQLDIKAHRGLIRLAPISAALYEGQYQGNMALDARGKTPRFSLNEELNRIHINPLLKDLMDKDILSGRADLKLQLKARGTDINTIKKQLNGTAKFALQNGAVKGVNIAQLIREATATIKGQAIQQNAQTPQTDFSALSGSIKITGGVASNKDLSLQSPFLRLSGQGTANLVNQRIDYRLHAKIVKTDTGQGGKAPQALKGVDIPIRVGGSFSQPSYRVDERFLVDLLKHKANKRLKKKLHKQEEKLQRKLEDKLQDNLRGLFR